MMSSFGSMQPCQRALDLLEQARNPAVTFVSMSQMRNELLAGHGPACVAAFDSEMKFRTTIATRVGGDTPSPDLATRITQNLARVDLSQLDVGDIEF